MNQPDYSEIEKRVLAQNREYTESHEDYARRKYGIEVLSLQQRQLIKMERYLSFYTGPIPSDRIKLKLYRMEAIIQQLETIKRYRPDIPNPPAQRTTVKDRIEGESKRQWVRPRRAPTYRGTRPTALGAPG